MGKLVDTHATTPDSHRANLRDVLAHVLKGLNAKASHKAVEAPNTIWATLSCILTKS